MTSLSATCIQLLQQAVPAGMAAHASVTRIRSLYWPERPGRMIFVLRPPTADATSHPVNEQYPSNAQAGTTLIDKLETLYALTYVIHGRATFFFNRRSYPVRTGSFLQFNGIHRFAHSNKMEPGFAECSVSLDGFMGEELLRLQLWNPRIISGNIGLHLSIVQLYLSLFDAMADLTQDAGVLLRKFFAIQDALYELYPAASADEQFRQRACRLFADHLEPSFCTADAARALRMPESTFRRKFTQCTGVAPGAYQLRLRMERAAQLLARHSVCETAELLGYSDPYVFSRQFKHVTGISPARYKRFHTIVNTTDAAPATTSSTPPVSHAPYNK